MNCRPNELAFLVRDANNLGFLGKILTTLYPAPKGVIFELPNGQLHEPMDQASAYWVCEFPREVAAPLNIGGSVSTRYAVVADSCLRPIRGGDQPHEDCALHLQALEGGAA